MLFLGPGGECNDRIRSLLKGRARTLRGPILRCNAADSGSTANRKEAGVFGMECVSGDTVNTILKSQQRPDPMGHFHQHKDSVFILTEMESHRVF